MLEIPGRRLLTVRDRVLSIVKEGYVLTNRLLVNALQHDEVCRALFLFARIIVIPDLLTLRIPAVAEIFKKVDAN